MALGGGGGQGHVRGRRRAKKRPLSEINVTPLVDVMLVLLIIFMISAPLLTVGVPLELPKTEAGAMEEQNEPLSISIQADGTIFIQESPVAFSQLADALRGLGEAGFDRPVFLRADGKTSYETVSQVMAALSSSGFTKIGIITDTGGPSSGLRATPENPN